MDRRVALAEGALDYVLRHGLVGLSLRPLAAELGTSDRMLIYHFGSKERLVSDVLSLAKRRLAGSVEQPGSEVARPADLVRHLWAALSTPTAAGITRLYLEVCVLAVQEPERWSTAPEQLRGSWRAPLQSGLVALGIAPERATPLADLILGTLDGLSLERLVATDPTRVDAAAAAFAELLDAGGVPPVG